MGARYEDMWGGGVWFRMDLGVGLGREWAENGRSVVGRAKIYE